MTNKIAQEYAGEKFYVNGYSCRSEYFYSFGPLSYQNAVKFANRLERTKKWDGISIERLWSPKDYRESFTSS